jgi:folate-dependent phosphoribosylglycinamide formyltransferase PurN
MNNQKIVLLAGRGITTNILYRALIKDFTIDTIILEDSIGKGMFLKKRVRHLGFWKVTGQVLFQVFIVKLLMLSSAKRKNEILREFNLEDAPLPQEKILSVKSVNEPECIAVLQRINPAIVVIIGTRIISKRVLDCIPANFVNIHAGITPRYRNVHGAYWALVNNDCENCGVTVHLVDPGIDTGSIIYQSRISISPRDNFITYPLLQLAEGIICLKKALHDILERKLVLKEGTPDSKIWHHPTLRQYLYHRLVHNKK